MRDVTTMPSKPRRSAVRDRADMKRDPLAFLCRTADEQGAVAPLTLDRPAFLLSGTDDIRHVLVTDRLNYLKEQRGVRWFRPIFGRSLPFLEGDRHAQVRGALRPNFRPAALDDLPEATRRSMQRVMTSWRDGQPLDVAEQMRQVTFAIAGRFILGLPGEEAERLYQAIQAVHLRIVLQMPGPVAWPKWQPPFFRQPRRRRRASRKLDALMHRFIEARRAGDIDGPDVLSSLLRAQAAGTLPISDEQVRDHCVNLVLAAIDPVAYSVAWALYFLADDPACAAAVADEARPALNGNAALTRRGMASLPWTQQTLSEALRLRPLTWLIERQPLTDAPLPSGIVLPAGSRVMISPYVLHRREILFPSPLTFDPHRFDAEAARKRSPYAFLPFGAGPRVCIGEAMAMTMGTVMLAAVAQDFGFERIDGRPIEHITLNGFTLQPPEGRFVMRCRRKTQQAAW